MKPKNQSDNGMWDDGWNQGYEDGKSEGYAAGLVAGARRERRAVMRRVVQQFNKMDEMGIFAGSYSNLRQWLTARSRRGKK